MKRSNHVVGGLLVVLLIASVAVVWSRHRLGRAYQAVLVEAREYEDCDRIAQQVRAIRDQPQRAESREILHVELTQRIEQCASAAGIEPARLTRIDPLPARRLSDGPYLEKPTTISLETVGLAQAVQLLHRVSREQTGLWVKEMRLEAPRGHEIGQYWNVEATLCYLIYQPLSTE